MAEKSADKFIVQETIKTAIGARTIGLDAVTHNVFLPTTNFEKATDARHPPKKNSRYF